MNQPRGKMNSPSPYSCVRAISSLLPLTEGKLPERPWGATGLNTVVRSDVFAEGKCLSGQRFSVSAGQHRHVGRHVVLEAGLLDALRHTPALRGASELILVPKPEEHHLRAPGGDFGIHGVDAQRAPGGGIARDRDGDVAYQVTVVREVRQHLGEPLLDLRVES